MSRVVLAALGLFAGQAAAFEVQLGQTPARVDVTSSTIGAWHTSNRNPSSCDDDFGELLQKLNLNGTYESWVLGLRIDGSYYNPRNEVRPATADILSCAEPDLRRRYLDTVTLPGLPGGPLPERLWVGYTQRNWEVTVGDSYVSFGRGLTLSLRKTDELGLDNTQRGVRFRLNTDRFTGTVVAGLTNINNVDEASGRYQEDPNDGVVGASADVNLFNRFRVGGAAVTYLWAEPVSGVIAEGSAYDERWLVAGPRIEAPRLTDWLGLYVEGVAQRRMPLNGEAETGYGLYGTATAYLGDFTVLAEAKAYGDLAVVQPTVDTVEFRPLQYASLPTLERVAQEVEHPQQDVVGGRVRVDWNVTPSLGLYLNHGTFRDWGGYLDPELVRAMPGTIHDPYVGADLHVGQHRVHAMAGARFVMVRGRALRTDGHVDLNVVSGLGGGHSVEAHIVHRERGKVDLFSEHAWREGTLTLGYRLRPIWALSAIVDYSTEEGDVGPDGTVAWYPGAQAEWEITPSSNLRVFAGTSRGGLKCVSGICRVFPPFSGVKGTLALRF